MSTDNSDKSNGLLANPLPIVMLVLLTAGVVVKNVPLESARPIDPERVKFAPATQQDVEARMWQDPLAAVEKYIEKENISNGNAKNDIKHEVDNLKKQINELLTHGEVTVVAVSIFGSSSLADAEWRRRMRSAVVSALGFHHYHPSVTDAIGYFNHQPESNGPGQGGGRFVVPYEWYKRGNPLSPYERDTSPFSKKPEKPPHVLVLWLNDDKFGANSTIPLLGQLKYLFGTLINDPASDKVRNALKVKLIGPAGSRALLGLFTNLNEQKQRPADGIKLQVFSPSATVSNCELASVLEDKTSVKTLNECIKIKSFPNLNNPDDSEATQIVRTIGTDDMLTVALLWELWQRGINRGAWRRPDNKIECKDGLVLISEWDSQYARSLSRSFSEGFLSLCGAGTDTLKQVRIFNYLRGLDGVLPDIKKIDANASHKDDVEKSKSLRAQLSDVSLEHAEGRSQYDHLRRLVGKIEQLNKDQQFAENGIKAIGIVGSDVYDKLLILQALRSRFKDNIFFTTDLDARYLHADQKEWARNLVIASNFDLSLRPELQQRASPFRDSYQTATYLATLMALDKQNNMSDWTDKMANWLHPQIFEIGRTEAVRLASPTAEYLRDWYQSKTVGFSPGGMSVQNKFKPCEPNHWPECADIEPYRPLLMPSFRYTVEIFVMFVIGLVLLAMASCRVREKLIAVKTALTPPVKVKTVKCLFTGMGLLVLGGGVFLYTKNAMYASYEQGVGEPFVWFEGISVWPSLVLDSIGLVLTLVFALALWFLIKEKACLISKEFNFALPQAWKLARSRWSAMCAGPYVDLALFNREGTTDPKPAGTKVHVSTLWQNYLRATSMREMMCWIVASTVIVGLLFAVAYRVFEMPSFPHRGQLVKNLNYILVSINALILWSVIFWVSYQTRACTQLTRVLSNMNSLWPKSLLARKEAETGVPRAYLSNCLDFQLIMRATERIHCLIYLPFISILFMVIARSDLLDAMNFPLVQVFVIGLVLVYALGSEVLLRRGAVAARTKVVSYYETLLLRMQAAPKVDLYGNPEINSQSNNPHNLANSKEPPISAEQIKLLLARIRNTREGVFAPITEQPALRALLLPFGGFGGAQLIDYLINLTV